MATGPPSGVALRRFRPPHLYRKNNRLHRRAGTARHSAPHPIPGKVVNLHTNDRANATRKSSTMTQYFPALAGALLLSATAAHAVEVTGGSIKLGFSAFTEDTSVNALSIEGSIEAAFNRSFSVQADLGFHDFGETDVDSHNLSLHAIYHVNDTTSFGAFYTAEDIEGADLDLFGVEAGYEMDRLEFEGYFGTGDFDDASDVDGDIFGASARYEFENGLGLTGSFDSFDVDNAFDLTRVAIKLDLDVTDQVNLYLEVGSADIDVDGISASETFVGLGGKIAFGAERGATFEQRGISRLLPGL
ncbi:porin [Sulfitobacter sp. S190]|nr:porin [Sulfitobacter sp. S190]